MLLRYGCQNTNSVSEDLGMQFFTSVRLGRCWGTNIHEYFVSGHNHLRPYLTIHRSLSSYRSTKTSLGLWQCHCTTHDTQVCLGLTALCRLTTVLLSDSITFDPLTYADREMRDNSCLGSAEVLIRLPQLLASLMDI